MKIKMCRVLIILSLLTYSCSERQDSIKYEVANKIISIIIESRASQIGYYYNEKPTYESNLKLDSIYTLMNLKTGELYTDSGWRIDSVRRSNFEIEYSKWKKKEQLNKRVFLIQPFNHGSFYNANRLKNLCDSSWILDIIREVNQSSPLHYNVDKLNQIDTLLLDYYSEEKREYYKYSVCGYIELSNIYVSSDNSKAIVFIGFLFSYKGGSENSGYGAVVLLEKQNGEWNVKKANSLWEV